MAFGALVIGGAAAAVRAFGLGGRDAAARTLSKLENKAESAPAASASSAPAGGTTVVPPRPDEQV